MDDLDFGFISAAEAFEAREAYEAELAALAEAPVYEVTEADVLRWAVMEGEA